MKYLLLGYALSARPASSVVFLLARNLQQATVHLEGATGQPMPASLPVHFLGPGEILVGFGRVPRTDRPSYPGPGSAGPSSSRHGLGEIPCCITRH
jgi:hypothetical protein